MMQPEEEEEGRRKKGRSGAARPFLPPPLALGHRRWCNVCACTYVPR